MSEPTESPEAGRRQLVQSVGDAEWADTRRGLADARRRGNLYAIAAAGLSGAFGILLVVFSAVPLLTIGVVALGLAVVGFLLSRSLLIKRDIGRATIALRQRVRESLEIDLTVDNLATLVNRGGCIAGQFRLSTTTDTGQVMIWAEDLNTAQYRRGFGWIGNSPY